MIFYVYIMIIFYLHDIKSIRFLLNNEREGWQKLRQISYMLYESETWCLREK